MNELAYPLTNYAEIAPEICGKLGGELFDNHYQYSGEVGEALVEFYNYEHFSLMFSHSKVHQDVKISRTPSTLKGYLAFDVLLKGHSQSFSVNSNEQLNQFNAGCYISTPITESSCVYEKGKNYDLLSVLIEKAWLESFIGKPLPDILQNPEEPLYIFTPLSGLLIASLSVLNQSDLQSAFRKPYLHVKTLEAITLAIESLQVGQKQYRQFGFAPQELETMFRLSNWLEENLSEDTSIQALSSRFGVNRNKLQSLFKSIYGQTLGEYVRSVKMNKAYELLFQNYSIAEVGHVLGYSNLSHFSKTFKTIYGCNPSEVQNKKK